MKYLVFAVSLFTISCMTNSELVDNMKYVKDSKTGLCFAAQSLGFQHDVMSNVPCTPEVERLIQGGGK